MIKLEQVSKYYSNGQHAKVALTNISLDVSTNECFGIVGPSGSGKSTLLRLINQLEQADGGNISLDGTDISTLSVNEQRLNRQKIGMIFQQFNLLNNKTVYENVALPLKLQKRLNHEKIAEMMAFVKISDLSHQYPQQLSGGQKQRVAIARALSFEPAILLCDEPTSALDEQHTEEIIQLLQRVQENFQTTLVIVSHEFSVIRKLCSRAAILEQGQLLDVIKVLPAITETTYDTYYKRALESLSQ